MPGARLGLGLGGEPGLNSAMRQQEAAHSRQVENECLGPKEEILHIPTAIGLFHLRTTSPPGF